MLKQELSIVALVQWYSTATPRCTIRHTHSGRQLATSVPPDQQLGLTVVFLGTAALHTGLCKKGRPFKNS